MNEIVSNLLVYGSLPEDSILWQLADICEKLKNQTETKAALRTRVFHQVKNLLTVATDYAFDKNLWHNYLTFLLITNENPFSLVCEKMGAQEGTVNNFVTHDFDMFKELFDYAENQPDGKLPVPVHLIADDFATGCPVPLFDQYISILREKQISVTLLIQSETQLASLYGDGPATTIRNNCDTYVYMGSNDLATAQNISVRANIPLKDILEMPIGSQILFRHGSKPHYGQRYNTFANAEYQNVLREYKKRVAKEFRLRQRVRSGQKSNQKNDDANRRHTAFLQEICIRVPSEKSFVGSVSAEEPDLLAQLFEE